MELPKGVEWAAHALVVLKVVGPDHPVSSAGLATVFDLSPTYLNKHLQTLASAGLVTSTPGPRGGFRLNLPAEQITLHDVVNALGSAEPIFRCTEIRCRGAFADQEHQIRRLGLCSINKAMLDAEMLWRKSLRSVSIADLAGELDEKTRYTMRDVVAPAIQAKENFR